MKFVVCLISFIALSLIGCKNGAVSPIKFKRPNKSYDLAIEGCLNSLNSMQFIKLTRPGMLPNGQVVPISGAIVSINDGNNEVFLSETSSPGIYSGNIFDNSNYGRSYTLKVHYNKKDYIAIDTLKRLSIQNDNLPVTASFLSNGNVALKVPKHIFGATEPIRWLVTYKGIDLWNQSKFNIEFKYTYSSQFGPPNALYPLTQEIRNVILNATDTVTIFKFSISQSYGTYLYNIFQETDFKSILSAEPGNVYGNISGNGQGYFYCTDVSIYKYLAKDLVK
jgi:hypothetical protein